jgi:hypothetical protein
MKLKLKFENDDEFERLQEEEVVVYLRSRGTKEIYEKLVTIKGLQAEIGTCDLPNSKFYYY